MKAAIVYSMAAMNIGFLSMFDYLYNIILPEKVNYNNSNLVKNIIS
ncbi:hypothetical protein BAOM_0656 [Peribacillus asahii]|uniref:Uncharacterized protein n=1 Tax=Peribacillus asahii TaxID=228899 RepID=A0A3Q9RKH8_9BACI|nr:hypothetical protein BAOM_0656 [Peribacillus asahii]